MDFDNSTVKQERLKNIAGITVNDRTYNLIIGLVLVWGIAIDIIMAMTMMNVILRMNPIVALIIYIAGSFGCTMIVYKSSNPFISFAGFTGLAISMGLILCYFVSAYELGTVSLAFQLTAIITVAMMILATLFPQFFMNIGAGLGIALIISIIVEVVAGLILRMNMSIMDYVLVIIFCGSIGFDWAKAQAYPRTVDNAIDSAADIYVDIVNLFIRILSILGKKDD
ncbi:MAG: US12 family protein [Blautia sp.]|nr:US12 family protein [Blautia sp.]